MCRIPLVLGGNQDFCAAPVFSGFFLRFPGDSDMQGLISTVETADAIVDAMDADTGAITFREQGK